ncbi:MAG: type I methionyl aminopeptidase [Alphaproteobacteria bacterium]|nr:type I methionyl aminopeptidase [Alphaproteobacteria bacterium]
MASIPIKSLIDLEEQKKSALLVSNCLAEIAKIIKPGLTTFEIDKFAENYIKDFGAKLSFKNYRGFPFNICASVNDVVIHGFPTKIPIKEGDLVDIDIGAFLNGFHGDQAYTFVVGTVESEILDLVSRVKHSLYKGIEQCIEGNTIGDIGAAIQFYTETMYGYGVVTELTGHGLGRDLHEDPSVPNRGKKGKGKILLENMVLAIEPMINLGKKDIVLDRDGWTYRTKDKKPSVHFEHNVVVKKNKPVLLTDFKVIEDAEKKNSNLNSSYY